MSELPKRKSARLKGYNYAAEGAYFITVCTHDKRCVLSTIRRGDPCGRPFPELTSAGMAVEAAMRRTEDLYNIRIDPFVIMPNHLHLLLTMPKPERRATARVAPTVGRIVGAIKSLSANQCRAQGAAIAPLWQRGYHDHVIRDEADCLRVWSYMDDNPAHWLEDCYYIPEE